MSKSELIAAFFFTGMFAGSQAGFADTHWVNLSGSNQPPYTSYAEGAHSIQDAIEEAVAGDTVRIAAGVFRPDTTVFLRDSIAIIGAGRDSTVIIPTKAASTPRSIFKLMGHVGGAGGGLTFKGCMVRGYKDTWTNYPSWNGIWIGEKQTTLNVVQDCEFHFCDRGAFLGYANVAVSDCYFDSNLIAIEIDFGGPFDIHHNTIRGRPLGGGLPVAYGIDGGQWPLLGPAKIHHNVIFTHQGIGVSASGFGDSISIYNNLIVSGGSRLLGAYCDCQGVSVRNNTVVRTAPDPGWGIAGFNAATGSRITIEGNVFLGKDGLVTFWASGGEFRFAYNNLWGLDTLPDGSRGLDYHPATGPDSIGNLYVNPMFVSDTTYRLQRGSPLIDGGNPLLLDPDSSRSDIGAYGGPEGLSYEYPEEPPQKPDTLIGELLSETFHLSWLRNTEADLSEYRLYRGSFSGFTPSPDNLLIALSPETPGYLDTITGLTGDAFYVLTAVDATSRESPPSNEVVYLYTGIFDGQESPGGDSNEACTLLVYPNPFNTATFIEFMGPPEALSGDDVRILVYDIRGARVDALVPIPQGLCRWTAVWNGVDKSGATLPSGVYFVRVTCGSFRIVRKLCLMR